MDGMKDKILAALLAPWLVAAIVVISFLLGMLHTWAVRKLYVWFLMPLGLPALSFWHIFGINVLIGLAIKQTLPTDKDKKWWEHLLMPVVGDLLAVGLGFLIKGWM